ncbi:hypothetical protein ACOZ38_21660 [Sphaerisporangium viridialbum]|uniref:hypothetical protein n=1 Tax=Sphaerisporangium viridialbum TaxID=46189 RepID=UPI003C78A01D
MRLLLNAAGIALASIAICASAVLISRSPSGATSAPASCPQRWGGAGIGDWVPQATGIDGAEASLVPGEPVAATICAYPGENFRPGGERLAGARTLTGQATAMARDLAYLPVTTGNRDSPCTAVGGPMTNYLIRFAYPGGQAIWVGTAEEVNACVTTTNGTTTSEAYLGPSITAAYRTGTWKVIRPDDPCDGPTQRRGQNEWMVPGRPVSVLVCGEAGSSGARRPRAQHGRQAATSLAAALNSPDTRPTDHTCQGGESTHSRVFHYLFGYADGPPASVVVWIGCVPGLDNGLLQADVDDSILNQAMRLTPRG